MKQLNEHEITQVSAGSLRSTLGNIIWYSSLTVAGITATILILPLTFIAYAVSPILELNPLTPLITAKNRIHNFFTLTKDDNSES